MKRVGQLLAAVGLWCARDGASGTVVEMAVWEGKIPDDVSHVYGITKARHLAWSSLPQHLTLASQPIQLQS